MANWKELEFEINDFPQQARWRVTHKETIDQINEWTGATITVRGQFYDARAKIPPGDRKLFLLIEGPSETSVKEAKRRVKELIKVSVSIILNTSTHFIIRSDSCMRPRPLKFS